MIKLRHFIFQPPEDNSETNELTRRVDELRREMTAKGEQVDQYVHH